MRCGASAPGPATPGPRSTRTTPRRSRAITTCRRHTRHSVMPIESIIEYTQHDLLRRAHPPTVISAEDAAALARRLPAVDRGDAPQRHHHRRAGGRDSRRVHRRMRGPAGRAARPGRQAVPCQAVGMPALSAGGVRASTRGKPVAAQSVLLPPMAADAGRAVHGDLRPLRRADRPSSPASIRPRCTPRLPRSATPTTNSRCGRRNAAHDTQATVSVEPYGEGRRSPFANADVCGEAGLCCPTARRVRCSTTIGGTSPQWWGYRCKCPCRTDVSISPRSPTRVGGWSPRS